MILAMGVKGGLEQLGNLKRKWDFRDIQMSEMKGGSMTGVKSGYTKPVNNVNKVKNWQI